MMVAARGVLRRAPGRGFRSGRPARPKCGSGGWPDATLRVLAAAAVPNDDTSKVRINQLACKTTDLGALPVRIDARKHNHDRALRRLSEVTFKAQAVVAAILMNKVLIEIVKVMLGRHAPMT